MDRALDWIDERAGIRAVWGAIFDRLIPRGVGWWYTFGSACLFLFILQATTGSFLAWYYSPTPDHAYDSILYIMNQVAFGSIIRGIHHWSASAMVVMVVAHMLRTFFFGAYKYPRELTWVVGVFLLLVTLGFSFTGYLLPWDEKAYWATVVGTEIAGSAPVVGDFILRLMRGGQELGAVTLARFYSIHVLLLPAAMVLFIGIHLFLVIKIGISAPPDDK